MGESKQLDLWYVLLVAERVSGKRAERLAEDLYRAGVELPLDEPVIVLSQLDPNAASVEDAVRLVGWIVHNLPIPEKERRLVAFLCMRKLLESSSWPPPGELTEEMAGTLKAFSAGTIGETKLTDWVHSWLAQGSQHSGDDATA